MSIDAIKEFMTEYPVSSLNSRAPLSIVVAASREVFSAFDGVQLLRVVAIK